MRRGSVHINELQSAPEAVHVSALPALEANEWQWRPRHGTAPEFRHHES
jgi:hypothetical protein